MIRIKHIFLFSLVVLTSCVKEEVTIDGYKTERVIIVVMDGARYSETWGYDNHQYIPGLTELSNSGVVNTQFFNDGSTKTVPGHTAITTGNYQEINNSGLEIPELPSLFQYWRQATDADSTEAWIIASKDKLEVLAGTNDPDWKGKLTPSTNAGIGGLGVGNGYRNDSLTYVEIIDLLSNVQPRIALINFREPDSSGHSGDWDRYIKGIRETDKYISKLWNFIEADPFYKGKTTLFITNDHGRHSDSVSTGFVGHGDDCTGCRHINLFAVGPDFKQGIEVNSVRGLIDISATIGELLDFEIPTGNGEVMSELFK